MSNNLDTWWCVCVYLTCFYCAPKRKWLNDWMFLQYVQFVARYIHQKQYSHPIWFICYYYFSHCFNVRVCLHFVLFLFALGLCTRLWFFFSSLTCVKKERIFICIYRHHNTEPKISLSQRLDSTHSQLNFSFCSMALLLAYTICHFISSFKQISIFHVKPPTKRCDLRQMNEQMCDRTNNNRKK